MCTILYLLSLSVWASRKPLNERQCIFLITRMSCELSSLKRTGNKCIYSCTPPPQIFCLLLKQPTKEAGDRSTDPQDAFSPETATMPAQSSLQVSEPPCAAFALNKSLINLTVHSAQVTCKQAKEFQL